MRKNGKKVKIFHGHDKKLIKNLGITSKYCKCGRLFTFKVRTASGINPYNFYDECQQCRGLQVKLKVQKFYCAYKSKSKTIPNKPNKERVQRRDAEIKSSTRVREEAKGDPRGLHLF